VAKITLGGDRHTGGPGLGTSLEESGHLLLEAFSLLLSLLCGALLLLDTLRLHDGHLLRGGSSLLCRHCAIYIKIKKYKAL